MRDELAFPICEDISHRASTEGTHIEYIRVIDVKFSFLQSPISYDQIPELIITFNIEDSQM
jgi:hypothetical protein